jgi:hypothetical protein
MTMKTLCCACDKWYLCFNTLFGTWIGFSAELGIGSDLNPFVLVCL